MNNLLIINISKIDQRSQKHKQANDYTQNEHKIDDKIDIYKVSSLVERIEKKADSLKSNFYLKNYKTTKKLKFSTI